MKEYVLKYLFVLFLICSCIRLNAQNENTASAINVAKMNQVTKSFIEGNYPLVVVDLSALRDICQGECAKLLITAQKCEDWLEEAKNYSQSSATSDLNRAIEYYEAIQKLRKDLARDDIPPDSSVDRKIIECQNKIEKERMKTIPPQKPDRTITFTEIDSGLVPPPPPPPSPHCPLYTKMIPFGYYQFKNDYKSWGYAYAGIAGASLAISCVAQIRMWDSNYEYLKQEYRDNYESIRNKAFGLFCLSWGINILDGLLWHSKPKGDDNGYSFTPIITPEYNGISLIYNLE